MGLMASRLRSSLSTGSASIRLLSNIRPGLHCNLRRSWPDHFRQCYCYVFASTQPRKVTKLNLEHVTRNCAHSPSKCFDMTSEDRKRVAPELRKWRGWGVCRCVTRCVVLRSPAPTCDCSIYAARNHARQLQVKLLTRLTSSPLSAPNMYTWNTWAYQTSHKLQFNLQATPKPELSGWTHWSLQKGRLTGPKQRRTKV